MCMYIDTYIYTCIYDKGKKRELGKLTFNKGEHYHEDTFF